MHCFIDYRATKEELNNLHRLNINPISIPKSKNVYEAIDGHTDIQLNLLKNDSQYKVIIQKNMPDQFKKFLKKTT